MSHFAAGQAGRRFRKCWPSRWTAPSVQHTKWVKVGSPIRARFLVLAPLHCSGRQQDGPYRAVDIGMVNRVDDFKIKQHLRLLIPHSSNRQITHPATSVAGSSTLLPHNWRRCYMAVRHGNQLPCNVTHFIVVANDVSSIEAIEAVVEREVFPVAVAHSRQGQQGLVVKQR